MADGLGAGATRLDNGGPAHDEGHAVAALVDVALAALKLAAAGVLILREARGVAGLGAVVAAEKHERVWRETVFVERRQHLADAMIGLHHEIAIGADAALADELGGDAVRKVR